MQAAQAQKSSRNAMQNAIKAMILLHQPVVTKCNNTVFRNPRCQTLGFRAAVISASPRALAARSGWWRVPMPEHLVQGTGPLIHTRGGEFLDACGGGSSTAPHGWLDGLKPGVFLDQISVKFDQRSLTCILPTEILSARCP